MYIEKLSLSNIKDILSSLFNGKNIKIKNINIDKASHDKETGFGSMDIDFEVLDGKYKADGYKTGKITLTDYFVVLNEYDEIKYGLDDKLNKKYHKAMIEEFEKIEARKAKKENLAQKYKKDVDYEEPAEEENAL